MSAAGAEGWLLGIEVGGTKLQLGIGRADGSLAALERLDVNPARGARGILDQIEAAICTLLHRMMLSPHDVRGIGVGFGGPVDVSRGRVHTSYQVEGWTDFPLAEKLRRSTGIAAVVIENDADTAGLAEARFGAGVGCSPLLYLTIGSGIGGALIVEGQIYRGCGLGAVEIGHMEIPVRSRSGIRIMQLEEVASGWGIAREARDEALGLSISSQERRKWVVLERSNNDPQAITAKHVAQAAIEGEERAEAILDRAREGVAFALRQAIAVLAPGRIILGGGVSLIGEAHWFEPIRGLVDAGVFAPFRGSYDIVPAALGEQVVVHGALALAHDAVGSSA
ncbi:MAG: ROK family protein [Isosphaeraceae bacterium]